MHKPSDIKFKQIEVIREYSFYGLTILASVLISWCASATPFTMEYQTAYITEPTCGLEGGTILVYSDPYKDLGAYTLKGVEVKISQDLCIQIITSEAHAGCGTTLGNLTLEYKGNGEYTVINYHPSKVKRILCTAAP